MLHLHSSRNGHNAPLDGRTINRHLDGYMSGSTNGPQRSRTHSMTPGHPALAFVNTVSDDGKTRKANSFATGAELVALLVEAGLVPQGTPAPGQGQMVALTALREAAYGVLSALAARRRPGREETLTLETAMKSALQDASFGFGAGGLALVPGPLGGLPDRVALALFDLMRRDDLDRLRECRRCTHLFLDHGRGQGRRWCSMARCGNRAKAETFRARQRATG
jgi:predicted RNA-binding Zn ribbon-like protein